jgi:hypothetical protein
MFRLGWVSGAVALTFGTVIALPIPQAQAANIITFGDNANSCGGSVMCSTNGTTGYLNNGTGQAFDLSTIKSWFQIDPNGINLLLTQRPRGRRNDLLADAERQFHVVDPFGQLQRRGLHR